jgi:hypothetical protein
MRPVVLALLLVVAFAVPAQARVVRIAPPGNSGVSQYDETIPTAGGSRPTSTVHPVGGGSHGSGGSQGSGGAGGSGGSGGSAGGGSAVSGSTFHALAAEGPQGAAAAALAQVTAPTRSQPAASKTGSRTDSSIAAASGGDGSSPVTSLVKAVTGSTSSGGLGPVLPVILIGSLLGAGALALMRRRHTS